MSTNKKIIQKIGPSTQKKLEEGQIPEKVAKEAQLHEEVLGVMQSQLKSGDISEKQLPFDFLIDSIL